MLPSWCRDTVFIIHPGTMLERGSTIPDWNNVERTECTGCSVQPAATSLSEDGRVLGINDGLTCYMPEGSPVLAGDRIEFNGKQYTIAGEVRDWPSATGRLDHIILNLVAYSG